VYDLVDDLESGSGLALGPVVSAVLGCPPGDPALDLVLAVAWSESARVADILGVALRSSRDFEHGLGRLLDGHRHGIVAAVASVAWDRNVVERVLEAPPVGVDGLLPAQNTVAVAHIVGGFGRHIEVPIEVAAQVEGGVLPAALGAEVAFAVYTAADSHHRKRSHFRSVLGSRSLLARHILHCMTYHIARARLGVLDDQRKTLGGLLEGGGAAGAVDRRNADRMPWLCTVSIQCDVVGCCDCVGARAH